MNWKFFIVPVAIVLVISLCANVYSFKKLASRTDTHIDLLEKQAQEIKELKSTLSTLETVNVATENEVSNEEATSTTAQIGNETSDLVNTTKRYLEYAFNVNPDNYMTAKNNAQNYMTEEMIDTIFVSEGVDADFSMQIKNIKVYTTDEKTKEVIAYYESEIETYDTTYVEKNYNYVLLKFIEENDTLKIASLTPINVAGAN